MGFMSMNVFVEKSFNLQMYSTSQKFKHTLLSIFHIAEHSEDIKAAKHLEKCFSVIRCVLSKRNEISCLLKAGLD